MVVPQKRQTGKGYWHFNNSLLEDSNYVDQLKQWWAEWRLDKMGYEHIAEWWDAGKYMIKDWTQQYCTEKNRRRDVYVNNIRKRLRNLENKPPGFAVNTGRAEHLREQLRRHEQDECESARVRLKFKTELESEKCIKYFFALVKNVQATNLMNSLRGDNGKVVHESKDNLGEVRSFYRDIYEEEEIVESEMDMMLRKIRKKVSRQGKVLCDSPLQLDDMTRSVKAMENGKSPGSDGLTSNFYKAFWDILDPDLRDTLTFCMNRGELTPSHRHAITSCLYMKGDKSLISNWRPIFLLNTDYKMFTKALANKMAVSLTEIKCASAIMYKIII